MLFMLYTGSKADTGDHSISTNDITDYIRFSGYSFVSKIFDPTKILGSTRKAPLQVILHVIQQEWKLSPEVMIDCEAVPKLQRPVLVDVPSSRKLSVCYFQFLKA